MDKYLDNVSELENDMEEQIPKEWKVVFEGDFWSLDKRKKAGEEIALNQTFVWADRSFLVPAMYLCNRGLVIDYCMKVDKHLVDAFRDKWKLDDEEAGYWELSEEEQMKIALDNPLQLDFETPILLNDKKYEHTFGCSISYNPCETEEEYNSPEVIQVMEHYNLDPSACWIIHRRSYPWNSRKIPDIKKLEVLMNQEPEQIPGPVIKAWEAGDSFDCIHPINGQKYSFQVLEVCFEEIPDRSLELQGMICPRQFVSMTYIGNPEIPERMQLLDCGGGDRPRECSVTDNSEGYHEGKTAGIAIIGGADGPTTIFVAGGNRGEKQQKKVGRAISALYFEIDKKRIEWRLVFHERKYEEMPFRLI